MTVAGGGESNCVVDSGGISDEDVSRGMRTFGTGEKKFLIDQEIEELKFSTKILCK